MYVNQRFHLVFIKANNILFWLIPLFLLIDVVNGALLQLHGASYGLSAIYKTLLLFLMALSLLYQAPKVLFAIMSLLIVMLIGPAFIWPSLGFSWLKQDIALGVKVISPLLAFGYFYYLYKRDSDKANQLFVRTLYLSGAVLVLNTAFGLLGLGFSAYQPLEGVSQSFLGIKGFFYSANELGAVLLVITAAFLVCIVNGIQRQTARNTFRFYYVLASFLSFAIAALLLTKTGMIGVLLLVFGVALVMQSLKFWQTKAQFLGVLYLVILLIVLLMFWQHERVLTLLGIFDKLQYVYEKRGVSGILLSSRDIYANKIWQLLSANFGTLQGYLGVGQGAIALYLKKYFAELDWFDLRVFFGVVGFLAWVITFAVFIGCALKHRHLPSARALLLLNCILLLVSSLAGHVLTSGMLWLLWAFCNAAFIQKHAKELT